MITRMATVVVAALLVSAAAHTQRRPVETVSAREILREYQANEIRASRRFEDRTVRVTGTVQSVDSRLFGGGSMTFETDSILAGVQALFDDDGVLVRLSRGQRVSVTCRDVSGGNVLGVVLDNCDRPR